MLAELLYPLQLGQTPLHLAIREGHTTYVERLLSTPGIDVNIKDKVRWSIEMLSYKASVYECACGLQLHYISCHTCVYCTDPPC